MFGFIERKMDEGIVEWKELSKNEKITKVYIPTLEAFEKEVMSFGNAEIMGRFLIGKYDFYKVIKDKDKDNGSLQIQSFNMEGTLKWGKKTPLPTEIISCKRKKDRKTDKPSDTTVILYMDEGWTLDFRVHNSRGNLRPVLQFDVEPVCYPESLYSHHMRYLDS